MISLRNDMLVYHYNMLVCLLTILLNGIIFVEHYHGVFDPVMFHEHPWCFMNKYFVLLLLNLKPAGEIISLYK